MWLSSAPASVDWPPRLPCSSAASTSRFTNSRASSRRSAPASRSAPTARAFCSRAAWKRPSPRFKCGRSAASCGTGAPEKPGTGSTSATKASSVSARRTSCFTAATCMGSWPTRCARRSEAVRGCKSCVAVASHGSHAEATFEDGSTVKAPYLIGADGIHSKVRVCLFGPSKPIFTGCIAWRGLIPMEKLPRHLARMVGTNWLGPRGNVLHYPVRRGEIMNYVSTSERDDWQIESWSTVGTTEELRNDFRDWHADVQAMIDQIETPYKWALMIREPMAAWSRGRVTLLGDACHPTLPFLGQGGVMSIEDGYLVAACLNKHFDEPDVAFARYEEIRRERTSMVVRKASENKASAFAPSLADKDRIAEEVAREWQQVRLRERMEWLYNYDATAVAI